MLSGCVSLHKIWANIFGSVLYETVLTFIKLKLLKQILISLHVYFIFCTFCGNYFENNLLQS